MAASFHRKWITGAAISAVSCLALGLARGEGDSPATAPAIKTTVKEASPAEKAAAFVNASVLDLTKEYAAFEKDPNSNHLRAHPDYFSTHSSPDITDDAVVAKVCSLGGSHAETYAKWQLLSAIPGKFDAKYTQRLLSAFNSHPELVERPGTTPRSKAMLTAAIRGKGVNDLGNINAEFEKAVSEVATKNALALQYMDDLYTKLAPDVFVIGAGFREAVNRAEMGVDSNLSSTVLASARTWATGGAPAPQLGEVHGMAVFLVNKMGGPTAAPAAKPPAKSGAAKTGAAKSAAARATSGNFTSDIDAPVTLASFVIPVGVVVPKTPAKSSSPTAAPVNSNVFPPMCYSGVSYDEKTKSLIWTAVKVKFVEKKLVEELAKSLVEMATNPGGGLKFDEAK